MPSLEVVRDGDMFFAPLIVPSPPEIPKNYLPENAHLHFVFGPHKAASHFDGPAELLKTSDIYIPEFAGQDLLETKDFYRRITHMSKGEFNKRMLPIGASHPFTFEQLKALRGTKMPIGIADASLGEVPELPSQVDLYESFDLQLEEIYAHQYHAARNLVLRDHIIAKRLGPVVTTLVNLRPKLQAQDQVRVLATLGYAHEGVYTQLLDSPAAAQLSASCWPFKLNSHRQAEVDTQYKIASNLPLSRTEIAGLYLGDCLNMLSSHGFRDRTNGKEHAAHTWVYDQLAKTPEESAEMMHRISIGVATLSERQQVQALIDQARTDYEQQAA